MLNKDKENLLDIIQAINKIFDYTKNFKNTEDFFISKINFDAVLMNFINIGESVLRLSNDLQISHPDIEWNKIKGLRNIVVHDYFGVDAEEIWQIVKNKLPKLHDQIETIINSL